MRKRHLAFTIAIVLALVSSGVPKPSAGAAAPATTGMPSAAELDQLLAPIALYPDSLLGQILLASTDPGMVVNLNDWLKTQKGKGSALQDAAVAAGFAPSYVALALFPQVVQAMVTSMSRTQRVGQAFSQDRPAVFDSIQRLRKQAQSAGSLKDTPQQDVETKTTSSGQQVIVIEPSNPQVIYVPQYNAQTVYTQPTTQTQTVIVEHEDHSSDAAVAGVIGFTAGIAIGAAVNNSYYYGPYGWHGGGYMYNDAWDDYYDHREDAREDWMEHREDMGENRSERYENASEQRTDRQQNRQENRPESQAAREQRRTDAQTKAQQSGVTREQRADTAATQGRGATASSYESRGVSGDRSTAQRSGTKSDAFSGYSSGSSERAASSRGSSSRGSSGGGSRGGGSRGGGGRRR